MISASDAGGIGGSPTENGENVQNAHFILVADDEIRQGLHTKASPLMWRSARCKRAVNSNEGDFSYEDITGQDKLPGGKNNREMEARLKKLP